MPKHLLPYARAIAEAPLDEVPQYSWGSAVLATTYRGLCTGCCKVISAEPIFLGCPLLLQLWSYERFPIVRPRIDMSPYPEGLNENDINRPMMGSLWFLRKVWFFNYNYSNRITIIQSHKCQIVILFVAGNMGGGADE